MNPGSGDEKTFALPLGVTTIGRTKDNGVFCLHKSLSRRHAQVDFDGIRLKVLDLQSKNGIFYNGRRVEECELLEGQRFRCGDVTFLLEGGTIRSPRLSPAAERALDRTAQTLPSPVVVRGGAIKTTPSARFPGGGPAAASGAISTAKAGAEEETTSRDRLFLLIRASELLVGQLPIDKLLEELVLLVVQVLDADRIAVLALDETTMSMRPRVLKTRVPPGHQPYSKRIVDWIVQTGSPASFADVSRDTSMPGDGSRDYNIRAAMAVPIDSGGGTIGVVYTDNLSTPDVFRADDLALLRGIANFCAVALEGAMLRTPSRQR